MTVSLDLEEESLDLPIQRKTPEAIMIDRSNWQLIQAALEDLPVHSREILLLC